MEEMKRNESERVNFTVPEKYYQPTTIAVEHPPSGKMAIDVYGQQIEPICNYRNVTINFQHMAIVGHADAATLSIMLQGCHYGQNR
jgi:hypothetical protein